MLSQARATKRGFTLIELLVVIAIIAILAAILFPVFAKVREKARITECVSNQKQFALAILQYVQDDDEDLPIAYKESKEAGPLLSQLFNEPQEGVHWEIMPYIQSANVFHCPDDGGFEADFTPNNTKPSACGLGMTCSGPHGGLAVGDPHAAQIAGQSYEAVLGTSYKFTHQNFSNPFTKKTLTGYAQTLTECPAGGTISGSNYTPPGGAGACTIKGPGVLALAYFQRPSETRMFRCYDPPFDQDDNHIWHPMGDTVAYVDGHVKFLTSIAQFNTGCDGADWAWDVPGSCDIQNVQRNAD
jgi:prepilin-type N-terminal cleavage/methylation domain-containing protein